MFVEQPLASPESANYLEGLFLVDMLCFGVVNFTKKKWSVFAFFLLRLVFAPFCFCCVYYCAQCMTM